MLFQNPQQLDQPNLERYAQQAGLNLTAFRAALANHTHATAIDADMRAVQTAGLQIGTPAFFINGRVVQGALPFDSFKQIIDRELANPSRPN